MKKAFVLSLGFIFLMSLAACQKTVTSPLVISKLFDAISQSNNVIELYNPSEESVDLKDYSLQFYTNASPDVTYTIALTGTIDAQDYFAIGSSNATDEALDGMFDFTYTEGSLPYNGNDSVELIKKGETIDYVGLIESDVDYAKDLTLIRLGEKGDYKPSKTFEMYNFIYYLPDMFQYLKNDNHEIKTLEDLYAGPQLEDRYLTMPYVDSSDTAIGGGGAVLTTLNGIADGDTAYFNAANGFGGGSVRYFYLNTPEVDGSFVDAEPWGYVASSYNKYYLLNDSSSKVIYVQSMLGYALEEVHGRSLALIWVNGSLSQFNIVSEGLSEDVGMIYNDYDKAMNYKNVPYLTFLRFAEHKAILNGWGTKGYPSNPDGEKSPDWNYETSSNTTKNPVWEPHLPLPWES